MIAIDIEMPRCCQNCFLIRYHDTLGYSCKATKNYITMDDVCLKRADDCPLVEIITCKDCKYYRADDDTGYCTNHTCGDNVFWCRDDYYCADAEKKSEEQV